MVVPIGRCRWSPGFGNHRLFIDYWLGYHRKIPFSTKSAQLPIFLHKMGKKVGIYALSTRKFLLGENILTVI